MSPLTKSLSVLSSLAALFGCATALLIAAMFGPNQAARMVLIPFTSFTLYATIGLVWRIAEDLRSLFHKQTRSVTFNTESVQAGDDR